MAASLACGLYGFSIYNADLQRAGTAFAGHAFKAIFVEHDEEFLRRNLAEAKRNLTPEQFIGLLPFAGERPRLVGQVQSAFVTRLEGLHLAVHGFFEVPVLYRGSMAIFLNMEIGRFGGSSSAARTTRLTTAASLAKVFASAYKGACHRGVFISSAFAAPRWARSRPPCASAAAS
jgi:hypothetical protein